MMLFSDWLNDIEIIELLDALCEENIFGTQQANTFRRALKVLPKEKRKHSERVTQNVHSLFEPTELNPTQQNTVIAALFHDFLERGGNHSVLYKLGLPQKSIEAINALTNENDKDPLKHLKSVFPTLKPELSNIVILVKISDRIDNLNIRADSGKISKNYLLKSTQLVNWLFSQYTGDKEYLQILRKRLRDFGVKVKKRHLRSW